MEKIRDFGTRLRALRTAANLTQDELADILGVTRSYLSHLEKNQRKPSYALIEKVASFFHVPVDELFGKLPESEPSWQAVKTIPVLGRIHAGTPWEAEPASEGTLAIPESMPAQFALRVRGDSMEPALMDGDWVICRTLAHGARPGEGSIVVALLNGSEATVKQLIRQDGGWALHAFNPAYADVPITAPTDTRIQAVVVAVTHMVDRGIERLPLPGLPILRASALPRRAAVDISDLDAEDQRRVQEFIHALRVSKRRRDADDLPDDLPF